MASAMHYEKSGKYIRDVAVDESRIHLELVSDRDGWLFWRGRGGDPGVQRKGPSWKDGRYRLVCVGCEGTGLFCAAGPGYFRFPEDPDHFPEKNGAGGE